MIIEVDVILWIIIEGGVVVLFLEIIGVICFNNCYDNGICVEGEEWFIL